MKKTYVYILFFYLFRVKKLQGLLSFLVLQVLPTPESKKPTPVRGRRVKVERLAKLVKELRSSQSQHQFAKKLGVSRSSITFWESGQAWPEVENLEKLAALKGWSLSDLQMYLVYGDSPEYEQTCPLEQILNTLRSLPSEAVAQVVNVGVETLVNRSITTPRSLSESA